VFMTSRREESSFSNVNRHDAVRDQWVARWQKDGKAKSATTRITRRPPSS
jgi:hypothetical protein